jgi:hypothetical protein
MDEYYEYDMGCKFISRVEKCIQAIELDIALEDLHKEWVEEGDWTEEEFLFAYKSAELLLKDRREHPKPPPSFRRVE